MRKKRYQATVGETSCPNLVRNEDQTEGRGKKKEERKKQGGSLLPSYMRRWKELGKAWPSY